MKFIDLLELEKAIGLDLGKRSDDFIEDLRKRYAAVFNNSKEHLVNGQTYTLQEVYFLLDLYEKEENRVFSQWVKSDDVLFSFLRNDDYAGASKTKKHDGHLLQEKYYKFVSNFLFSKLSTCIDKSCSNANVKSLMVELDLTKVLPAKNRIEAQQKIVTYIDDVIKNAQTGDQKYIDVLFLPEITLLINELDETFYALKVSFIDSVKSIIIRNKEHSVIAFKRLRQLDLHSAHRKEVNQFIHQQSNLKNRKGSLSLTFLLRTPLFYAGVLVLSILIYLLIPKEIVKPKKHSGTPQMRTGLDSLSLGEIHGADTLLGYKEDSSLTDLEDQLVPNVIENYQVIESDDTLINELAQALSKSMAADYQIQETQEDSEDCQPLKLSQKEAFQMEGVKSTNSLVGEHQHQLENSTSYDMYILLFENRVNGNVFGSFLPAGGKLNFSYNEGMRMMIYSGKELTEFNPLLQKNGGYGSVVFSKRIDQRFTAHFCELNVYNLQLMSKSWVAKGSGRFTKIYDDGGPLKLESNTFEL